jgi:hypothetical protein
MNIFTKLIHYFQSANVRCGLDPQSPNPKNNQEIAGQARNDAVGKYRYLIIGMTLVFSLYTSDITFGGGRGRLDFVCIKSNINLLHGIKNHNTSK